MRITRLAYLIADSTRPHYQVAADAGIDPGKFSKYVNGCSVILDTHQQRLCALLGSTSVTGWVDLIPA